MRIALFLLSVCALLPAGLMAEERLSAADKSEPEKEANTSRPQPAPEPQPPPPQQQKDARRGAEALPPNAGDIVLLDTKGRRTRLSEHLAKANVLALWNRYCEPCLKEMPLLERLRKKYARPPQVAILSIACEEETDPAELQLLEKMARERGLQTKILIDHEEKLMNWLCSRLPTPEGSRKMTHLFPLNAVADANWNMVFFLGLEMDQEKETLDNFSSKIELARAGKLSGVDCYPDCRILADMQAAVRGGPGEAADVPVYLRFEKLTAEKIPQRLESVRTFLKENFPKLSEQEIRDILKQA